jgi:hypothetical protein
MTEVCNTETQLLITFELRSYGVRISVIESSLTKSQSVWHSSKSRVSLSKAYLAISGHIALTDFDGDLDAF